MTKPTVEQLMMPRWKVILDFPNSPYKVGQILEGESYRKFPPYENKFPHIFQPIEWWEHRNLHKKEIEAEVISLIPYLKANGRMHEGQVLKVKEFTARLFGYASGVRDAFESETPDSYGNKIFDLKYFDPATLEEYTDYINQQKQTV